MTTGSVDTPKNNVVRIPGWLRPQEPGTAIIQQARRHVRSKTSRAARKRRYWAWCGSSFADQSQEVTTRIAWLLRAQ